jgi:uncharacterized protein (TIGR02453 family)
MPKRPSRSAAKADPDLRFAGFDPGIFRYLTALKRHNRREWFEAHRGEYETLVRDAMRAFVEEMDVRLARLAPELLGDPRRSLFRIHRDVRFSADKSPYKTHTACWFFHHDAGRGVGSEAHGGAGLYVHIEPNQSMVGGGIWMPPKPTLDLIRDAIAESPKALPKLLKAPAFVRRFGGLSEEARLTRVPRGFAPDHPAAEWLRLKSFTAGRDLSNAEILDPKLPAKLEADISAILPLVRWLNQTIGFLPASSRL